jgi:hypothetical protein
MAAGRAPSLMRDLIHPHLGVFGLKPTPLVYSHFLDFPRATFVAPDFLDFPRGAFAFIHT